MTRRRIHVRFVIKSLEVEGGGAERVLVDVSNGLISRGHEVSAVTFDREDAPTFYPLDARVKLTGVAIGCPGQPTSLLKFLSGFLHLRREAVAGRPDIVIGFMHSTYVPLALATIGSGLRLIASEHVGQAHFQQRRLQRWLIRVLDRCFLAKTVPTERQRAELPESLRSKVWILPNPVDLHRFACDVDPVAVQSRVVLCVGRFMEEKDHAVLLDAFSRVAPEFPAWTLRLVGDGELRSQLETQISRLDLRERVEMPGVVTDVATEYARASIVAVPSRYESFGLAVVEALASARPVLGFRNCLQPLGIAADGHNALLVDDENGRIENLARGLRTLMADAGLRQKLGQSGPASVQHFSLDAVVDQWEDFFLQCVGSA